MILDLPQMMNRILKILPNAITATNFEEGFKCAFESDQNEGDKMQNLLTCFYNHHFDNKNDLTIRDTTLRKMLNSIKRKDEVPVGDDDFNVMIQSVKVKLWKTKEYHDIELVCTDEVHVQCHKAILSISPWFAKFDIDLNPHFYPVNYASKPFLLFLEILYTGKVTIENTPCEILFDFYHLLKKSDFHDLANIVVTALKATMNETNYTKMMDFYFPEHVDDLECLIKIQEYAKTGGPRSLCEIYVLCKTNNSSMLKQVIQYMVAAIKQENSSSWLAALDEHEIDDQSLWEKLGTTMNPDTFHMWNIFQNKLAKANSEANSRFDKLEKESFEKDKLASSHIEKLEKENIEKDRKISEWQERIERIDKKLEGMK
jgi:hypothetical protein